MGWDVVAIGTNHKLPVQDPLEVAKILAPLLDGVLSIGYDQQWKFSPDTNSISEGDYEWREVSSLVTNPQGERYRFILVNEAARRIYSQVKSLENIVFNDIYTKECFLSDVFDPPFRLYNIDSEGKRFFMLDVLNENVDFDVNINGRWFYFVDIFRKPYMGENKQNIDAFRRHIYSQLKICGCDKAYYFSDQGFDEALYNIINLPSEEWVAYMRSREYIDDDDNSEVIMKMSDYLTGKFVLLYDQNIICVVDDFSDMKE